MARIALVDGRYYGTGGFCLGDFYCPSSLFSSSNFPSLRSDSERCLVGIGLAGDIFHGLVNCKEEGRLVSKALCMRRRTVDGRKEAVI
jgi:hypothetical protein